MTREEANVLLKMMFAFWANTHEQTNVEMEMALNLALTALRPVSREQLEKVWRGEWKCHGDCGVTECSACGWNIEEYVGDYNFCPVCGAPMTDEAVDMVMERLEIMKDGNSVKR